MGLFGNIVKAVYKPLDVAITTFAHPIKVASAILSPTKTVSQVVAQTTAQTKSKQITDVILAGVGYATAGASVAKVATVGVAKAASALIPSTMKGKAIAAAVAIPTVGAIVSQPSATLGAISKTPSALANVGGNIAKAAANPSVENFKNIVTENPVIVGAAVTGAALLGASKLLPAIATARQTEAIQEQTQAIEAATPKIVESGKVKLTELPDGSRVSQQPEYTPSPVAVTPSTSAISAGNAKTSPKRKRRVTRQIQGNISQKVNVVLQNRSNSTGLHLSKRYINRELLLN